MRKKPTIEFIQDSFKNNNYECLTKVYINNKRKLEYICPEGHRDNISWNSWQNGHRCKKCASKKVSNAQKNDWEIIKKSFSDAGWLLLSTEYIGAHGKLDCICPLGHVQTKTWNKWNRGQRCFKCVVLNNSGCNSVHWKGGISKEPYCQDWTRDLKDFVKERDGYKCMNPDCWGKDDMLHVHHINYNKKSCGPENLITVCRSCNTRANKDRNWHEAWYKAILHRRYNYI